MPNAIVTGASRGLGAALAEGLAVSGWSVVIDARGEKALRDTEAHIRRQAGAQAAIVALAGDVTDPEHRRRLVAAADMGGLDLLVNNASVLGPSPQPALVAYPEVALRAVFDANLFAPVALIQEAAALLRCSSNPRIVNVTSDASVEAYEGWGGYGASKAALDQASAVLAVEEPRIRVWAADPGDMRTQMHQEAFPGEDITDRPLPETVVPGLLALIGSDRPSGRYRIGDLTPSTTEVIP